MPLKFNPITSQLDLVNTSTGAIGPQGVQGNQGFQGSQGSQGNQGTQGVQGIQGVQGNQGNQGSQGNQGYQGNQGSMASLSVTTKGDIQTYSTTPARLPVGTDGQILESRASETTGLKWITNTVPVKATALENVTGTDDAKFLTALSNVPAFQKSLSANCIINGGFTVNQRVYVSAATLSAGAYGHDRWKAGGSGGDYSFTQLPQSTQITIASGKSLIQVIEDKNVIGGTYTLSWTGTAQARFGIDSDTPSGAYAASPITITTQTAGTVMSVEFNTGTLSNVVLNSGSTALTFMPKSFEEELRACQRYYEKSYEYTVVPGTAVSESTGQIFQQGHSSGMGTVTYFFKVPKRIATTPTIYDKAGTAGKCSFYDGDYRVNGTITFNTAGINYGFLMNLTANATQTLFSWVVSAEL